MFFSTLSFGLEVVADGFVYNVVKLIVLTFMLDSCCQVGRGALCAHKTQTPAGKGHANINVLC